MKKLGILLVLVLLAFGAQAQDRSQIIGKWQVDKKLTFKVNPKLQKEYNEADADNKERLDTSLQITINFREDGTALEKWGDNTYYYTWELKGKLIKVYDEENDKDVTFEVISVDANSMVILEDEKVGLKRIK